jgi:hypothetical protein
MIARIIKKGIEAFWRSPGCLSSHQMKNMRPSIVDMVIMMRNFHSDQPCSATIPYPVDWAKFSVRFIFLRGRPAITILISSFLSQPSWRWSFSAASAHSICASSSRRLLFSISYSSCCWISLTVTGFSWHLTGVSSLSIRINWILLCQNTIIIHYIEWFGDTLINSTLAKSVRENNHRIPRSFL